MADVAAVVRGNVLTYTRTRRRMTVFLPLVKTTRSLSTLIAAPVLAYRVYRG